MSDSFIDTLYKVYKSLFVVLVISLLIIELVLGFALVTRFSMSPVLVIATFICTLVALSPMLLMFKIISSLKNIEHTILYSKSDKGVDKLNCDEAKDSKPIELYK